MANEATVRISLGIRKSSSGVVTLAYQSQPTGTTVTVTGTKGPTPGALTIPTGGKVIPMGELVTPGLCWMINNDATNYVQYGIRDPDYNRFYPLGELLPGVPVVLMLSRDLLEEYIGTGTGTSSPGNQFFMKAIGGDCVVQVEAFER